MKRFHVHVHVGNLDASVRFYSMLFGSAPTVRKPDYAKWMLEDPRVNFAISRRDRVTGVDHLGVQADYSAPATPADSTKSDTCCGPRSSCCGPKASVARAGA